MKTQNGLKQNDTSNTTGNKASYFEAEPIPNTPFIKVRTGKNEYSGAVGKHRVTEFYNTEQELMDKINQKDWMLITSLIGAMINNDQEIKELFKTNNNE